MFHDGSHQICRVMRVFIITTWPWLWHVLALPQHLQVCNPFRRFHYQLLHHLSVHKQQQSHFHSDTSLGFISSFSPRQAEGHQNAVSLLLMTVFMNQQISFWLHRKMVSTEKCNAIALHSWNQNVALFENTICCNLSSFAA